MNLPVWYAAFATAALVLVLAGAAKLVRPNDTARALRQAGIPATPLVVRAGSAVEVAVGVAALATGSRISAALLAASYAAFAVFVGQALVRNLPLATCGCLGEPDTPPTAVHVVLDAALALAALAAVVRPVHGLGHELAGHPAQTVVLAGLVALAVHLVVTALSALPATTAAGWRQ